MKFYNKDLLKIVISALLLIISFFLKDSLKLGALLVSYCLISYSMYLETLKDFQKKEIFNENFLMIVASLGAFYIGSETEAVLVILLFELGEYLSDLAVNKSKSSITKLMDLRADKVNIEIKGQIVEVNIEEVKEGDQYIVKPGEKIPLDGTVIEGSSFLDTSSLTGESIPKRVGVNDKILSGCINKNSILKVKATSTYKTTSAQKIIDLIENSNNNKSKTETFIRKFAKIYTPAVVFSAFLITLIQVILGHDFSSCLYHSLVFLVTSCPCALVISVPLGYFCGIGASSRAGILIKGSKELESLKDVDYLLLDKTGTITEGVFEITSIHTDMPQKDFINILASAEENSTHPIAEVIKKANNLKLQTVKDYQEIPGKGITCTINNKQVIVGNNSLLEEYKIKCTLPKEMGTIIFLAINKKTQGYIVISDRIKESSREIYNLKSIIKKDILILSGDNKTAVESVSKELGLKNYYSDLLPIDKVNYVKKYQKKGKVMFIGDGINDAPVIKLADIGVSLGKIGSDAAIEASDLVLMTDNIMKIRTAINISLTTQKKIRQSIILTLSVKFLILLLGFLGLSTIYMAVFADVGVTLLAILNILFIYKKKNT